MYPILLDIGKLKFYTYGLFVAIGFFVALGVSERFAKNERIAQQHITTIFFLILIFGLAGARLLYVFINYDAYRNNFLEIFSPWKGGLVFFGGFCMAVLSTAIFLKIKKLPLWNTADIIAPGIALGHAFGRVGCLFAGCCYGKPCDLPIGIKFSHPESLAPLGVYLHPVQIYSVISNVLIFAILVWIFKHRRFDGMVFLSYIIMYSLFRSIIEFFRGDFRGAFFFDFISLSQGIGLSVSVIALLLLIKLSRSHYGSH